MKLHFPWPEGAKILNEVRAATIVNPLYGTETGKGLWLVGDHGVYLMPNTQGETRTIAYAKECHPERLDFDEWWSVKQATFGRDDGVEFISIEEVDRISAAPPALEPVSLCVNFTTTRMTISMQWKRAKKGGTV
jgi:hypothetical protein